MTIFPTAYFGNIEYFRKLVNAQNPVFDLGEHFIKQTQRSRCEILGANGVQHLTIPVTKSKGSKTPVSEIVISKQEDWQRIHWKAIESAYGSAPYFDFYGIEVHELIFSTELNLATFNFKIIERVLIWLDVDIKYEVSEDYIDSTNNQDLRLYDFSDKNNPMKKYVQVFANYNEFFPNLSILDLIFCEGPMARKWIV